MTVRIAVIAGRFAPICNVHLGQVWQALKAHDEVVIAVTDADLSRSSRLPWTADERLEMARSALIDFGDRVHYQTADAPEPSATEPFAGEQEKAMAALYSEDDSTLATIIPTAILAQVKSLRDGPRFAGFLEEHRYLEAYKAAWAAAPYPVIMVSVDTLIVHAGHLLLVERGGVPGKGLWALPGGFVEPNEWLVKAALRELCEETGLQLSDDQATQRLKSHYVFDDPWRSARGRVITHAYHFELEGDDQPLVSGQDDAAAARWVPLAELAAMRGQFFDDHNRIISHFLEI